MDDADRTVYVNALRSSVADAAVAVHAYSLLETEVRLLVTPSAHESLARLMQAIGRRYVNIFNRTHKRSGTPWEGRFRSTVIEADQHLLSAMRYVESPYLERATAPDLLSGSSVDHHLGRRIDPLISEHPIFWTLGNTPFEREVAYRRFLNEPVETAEQAKIMEAANFGWPLGSATFKVAVQDETGRRTQRRQPGRPQTGKFGTAI